MKEIYYYIDEAGGINNDSNYFILGCYKTDTPEKIRESLKRLHDEITNDPYFAFERTKFLKQGFHATKNHPDIRSRMYSLIATLNVRGYILILDKNSDYFLRLNSQGLSSDQKYMNCIEKLIRDRLVKNRHEKNILVFEQYGAKSQIWHNSIEQVLVKIKGHIHESFEVELNYNFVVHDKSDLNLSIIDYINYIFVQFFEKGGRENRMIENFKIIEPKIGLIYKMDSQFFYDKNNRLDIK